MQFYLEVPDKRYHFNEPQEETAAGHIVTKHSRRVLLEGKDQKVRNLRTDICAGYMRRLYIASGWADIFLSFGGRHFHSQWNPNTFLYCTLDAPEFRLRLLATCTTAIAFHVLLYFRVQQSNGTLETLASSIPKGVCIVCYHLSILNNFYR